MWPCTAGAKSFNSYPRDSVTCDNPTGVLSRHVTPLHATPRENVTFCHVTSRFVTHSWESLQRSCKHLLRRNGAYRFCLTTSCAKCVACSCFSLLFCRGYAQHTYAAHVQNCQVF